MPVHRCDVHVDGDLLRFFIGDDLVKTAARTSRGKVRNKRAFRTREQAYPLTQSVKDQPKHIRQPSPDTEQGHCRGHCVMSQDIGIVPNLRSGSRLVDLT